MVTLKDIANKAGVSVMTVSRVVNGRLSQVSEETAQKILAIIKESGYVPNSSARSLSSKTSQIISVILRGKGDGLKDAYNSIMVGDIIQFVQSHDYYIMVNEIDDYRDITRRLRAWNAEGAIFLGTFDKDILQIQEDNQIPLIFTDSYSPIRQITNVGIDDYKGGVLAAKHFLAKGHRSLAFVGIGLDSSGVIQHRLRGFQDTLAGAGLALDPVHILTEGNYDNLARQVVSFQKPVTGIFTTADVVAVGLIDKMTSMGLKIPESYSFIGFDDLPLGYYTTPKLTTIAQDINRKAYLASDILFRHINDRSLPSENITLDVQLIERNSVHRIDL